MYTIERESSMYNIGSNKIFGHVSMTRSKIIFKGERNSVIFKENAHLHDSKIVFEGNNSILYIESDLTIFSLIGHNCLICILKNNNFVSTIQINVAENKTVFIGSDNMIARDVKIWNSDFHPIFASDTNKRVNISNNVFIGDHVWIGEDATILKGATIHSGSIIGYRSNVTGGEYHNNCIYAGNPARLIKRNIFWDRRNLRKIYNCNNNISNNDYIYDNNNSITNNILDSFELIYANKRLDFILDIIKFNSHKNRFS